MQCSVVIPCFNGAALTRACIASLLAQVGAPALEILVVDNGSTDDTAELGALDPRVRVLRQPHNLGFAGGVNAGIRAARHPLILVVNNDTQAAANLLQELVAALDCDPRIGAVAPVSNHVKGRAYLPCGSGGREPDRRAEIAAELAQHHVRLQDSDTLAGLCLLFRRRVVDEVGWFDERFGHGNFEDDDWCLRLRLHGYRLVIARRAFLHHEGHATFKAMGIELKAAIEQRQAQFIAKWQHDPAGRATIAALHGDLAGAAAAAACARRAWPHWPDADWHLARWHAANGDTEGAANHFAAFLRQCPRHSEAAIELGVQLLHAGAAEAAQRQFAWTSTHCQMTPETQLYLLRRIGEHAERNGHWHTAASSFRAALTLAPDDGALHNHLGLCELQSDDVAAAQESFTRAIERGFALAHTNRGICHHREARLELALADFETAAILLPQDRVAQNNRAMLRQLLGSGSAQ